jgi:hypothetical protein
MGKGECPLKKGKNTKKKMILSIIPQDLGRKTGGNVV